MCWRDENEIYNNGNAFKMVCRDHRGVIVTIIADNYYGYCKKEVKTSDQLCGQSCTGCARRSMPAAPSRFPLTYWARIFAADGPRSIKKIRL